MTQIRILFFHRWVGVHVGGTETHIKELASRLSKRGHLVHILTREGDELKGYESLMRIWRVTKNWKESPFSYEDIRVYVYTLMFLFKSFFRLLTLRLKGIQFDVVSVHFVTEAFLIRLVRWLFGWPYVFVLEGYTDLEAREAKHANLQIAISQDITDKCFANYGYKPLFIPPGIDLERFNAEVDGSGIRKQYSKNNEKLILTACRLDPRKDISTLVFAASIVCGQDPHIKFIIAGDGIEREKIERQIKDLGLSDKVKIIRKTVTPEYYRACDIFVLPSLYEGFGIVFLEAMASGIPIISTTAPAIPEVVGESGVLVPPRKPDLLAEKILQVINDDKLREKLREKGFERVKKYDWDGIVVEYEKAYESVIKPKMEPYN